MAKLNGWVNAGSETKTINTTSLPTCWKFYSVLLYWWSVLFDKDNTVIM